MSSRKRNRRRVTYIALLGLVLVAVAINGFSGRGRNPNSLLTGRWLLTLKGSPNALRYVEISPSGSVTAYKLDGTTIDMVAGYRETWSVRGNIIESVGQFPAPKKPLLTTMKDAVAQMLSSQRQPQEPTRYAYKIEDESTLQMELLSSQTPHCVVLKRVPTTDN